MAIQPLDPNEDDFLMDEVLASKRSARRRSVEQIQYDLWQAEKKRAILRASPSERDT